MNIGLVITTLGREQELRRLLRSLEGQLTTTDVIVIVAQRNLEAVRKLAREFTALTCEIVVTTSPMGASRGRNAGVEALPAGVDYLLHFPNDTTWFPPGTIAGIRSTPSTASAGALTVTDENGPKFQLPAPGTPLDRWNVWTVIEMGLVIRRSVFTMIGGFAESIGTGASTPWQSGEATDLLLRLIRSGQADSFVWLPAETSIGGISDPHGLSNVERRRKLRTYARGFGRLLTNWKYPLYWRAAALAGGLLFGVRYRSSFQAADGWWVFVGRFEGLTGHCFGTTLSTAVDR
ncbi:glycosyltransferase family 2 protein [Cryobacterium luteum]|uniref:Uncharacterized protein n=1 Tax=Cryobacterium luteum TaxID=1424661 RepID=A0A1H8KPS0_9MICO|nr:hypothetical protein [Cryobacterium luteum]TFB95052.1 hypothetical protein E3O10_01010 [Cryobacterium luteum]SEN94899.1 Glycosyltransferase, GT2 family [Cryobacterium luteum]